MAKKAKEEAVEESTAMESAPVDANGSPAVDGESLPPLPQPEAPQPEAFSMQDKESSNESILGSLHAALDVAKKMPGERALKIANKISEAIGAVR